MTHYDTSWHIMTHSRHIHNTFIGRERARESHNSGLNRQTDIHRNERSQKLFLPTKYSNENYNNNPFVTYITISCWGMEVCKGVNWVNPCQMLVGVKTFWHWYEVNIIRGKSLLSSLLLLSNFQTKHCHNSHRRLINK